MNPFGMQMPSAMGLGASPAASPFGGAPQTPATPAPAATGSLNMAPAYQSPATRYTPPSANFGGALQNTTGNLQALQSQLQPYAPRPGLPSGNSDPFAAYRYGEGAPVGAGYFFNPVIYANSNGKYGDEFDPTINYGAMYANDMKGGYRLPESNTFGASNQSGGFPTTGHGALVNGSKPGLLADMGDINEDPNYRGY